MARHFSEIDATMSTNYVQTREYRAPELILNCPVVTKAIDIWSLGCIMYVVHKISILTCRAEIMRQGKVLFAGSSPVKQMDEIIKVLGTPKPKQIRASEAGYSFLLGLPYREGVPLSSVVRNCTYGPLALDLVSKMLVFCPDDRITALQAMKHPWLAEFYDENSVAFLSNLEPFDFSYENHLHTKEDIKQCAFKLILDYEGIIQNNKSPIQSPLSPIERQTSRLSIRLTSPIAIASQRELILSMTGRHEPLTPEKYWWTKFTEYCSKLVWFCCA
jgi:serine/threonine protein kinase